MRKLAIILISILLTACRGATQYQSLTQDWVGVSASELVAKWGEPTSKITMSNGNTEYRYNAIQKIQYADTVNPSYATVTGSGQVVTSPTEVVSGDTYFLKCETTFEVDENNIVVAVYAEGNSCDVSAQLAALITHT
jgi:hypothetical protein